MGPQFRCECHRQRRDWLHVRPADVGTSRLKGTAERVVGDITINSYHPYIAFNLTPADAPLRPYLLIGFGATSYG